MTPIFQTPTELIAALRATVESYDRCGGRIAPGFHPQVIGTYITAIKQAADMLERLRSQPEIVVDDRLAVRLAHHFWAAIQRQKGGTDIRASMLADENHGGGAEYFKQALQLALAEQAAPPVDLRPQYPEIATTVARACAAWPGDYSSIAVALMDGHTNMQMTAADAIASLILLLQNVTKSPLNLSAALQERYAEARAWREQQGDPPQWSQG
jgi:hypothetical protein